jgi:serine/threonine protein kinase
MHAPHYFTLPMLAAMRVAAYAARTGVAMHNLVGKQLGGYTVIERIALGGMAAVYRARQPSTEREVAIKVMLVSLAADSSLVTRFEREAKLLAGLQHPHLMPVFDFGRQGELLYFVTPLLSHGDLGDHLARWGEALPLPEVRRIMTQLCDALDYAHQAGVVHRDLKPANVLLDQRGNCLLSDFGIAKLAGSAGLTQAGMVVGTPEYMSPEQGAGRAVDARSDLYALGVILFELCTGRVPFKADSPTALIIKHEQDAIPSARALNPAVPVALDAVIARALAKKPGDRYASAAALGEAIRQAIPDDITQPSPSAPAATRVLSTTAPAPAATVVHEPLPPVSTAKTAARTTPDAPSRSHWMAGALGLLGLALSTVLWFWFQRESMPPVSTPSTDATVLDNFDDPRFDGAYDLQRWRPTKTFTRTSVMQLRGTLRIATNGQNEGVVTELPERVQGRALRRVSADLRLFGPVVANHATGGFVLTRSDRADWWLACYAYGSNTTAAFTPTCTDPGGVYRTGTARAGEAFFDMSAEPDYARGVFVLRADDEALGELPLPHVGEGVTWYLTLTAWSGDETPVVADINAVRVE